MIPPLLRVTVAICTHNRAVLLRETLAGVTQQDYPREALDVLVIDNASRDDTRAIAASFADARHPPRYVLESRIGLNHARNRAIAEAQGDVLLLGDDDILVEPDWVRQIAAPFAADTGNAIGCVGGEVLPVFPDGRPDWIADWHAPLAFRADAGPLPSAQSPMGANLAFRRSVFARVGSFATELDRRGRHQFSGGDRDMIQRVRAAGFAVWFAPAAQVRHQMTASRTTWRHAIRHAFDSARSRVIERTGRPGFVAYGLSRLVANPLKVVVFLLCALLEIIVLRRGGAKRALVRAGRACGYLYQIPRSLAGKI